MAELPRENLAKTASSQEGDGFRMSRRAGGLASLVLLVLALAEHEYVVLREDPPNGITTGRKRPASKHSF